MFQTQKASVRRLCGTGTELNFSPEATQHLQRPESTVHVCAFVGEKITAHGAWYAIRDRGRMHAHACPAVH